MSSASTAHTAKVKPSWKNKCPKSETPPRQNPGAQEEPGPPTTPELLQQRCPRMAIARKNHWPIPRRSEFKNMKKVKHYPRGKLARILLTQFHSKIKFFQHCKDHRAPPEPPVQCSITPKLSPQPSKILPVAKESLLVQNVMQLQSINSSFNYFRIKAISNISWPQSLHSENPFFRVNRHEKLY